MAMAGVYVHLVVHHLIAVLLQVAVFVWNATLPRVVLQTPPPTGNVSQLAAYTDQLKRDDESAAP